MGWRNGRALTLALSCTIGCKDKSEFDSMGTGTTSEPPAEDVRYNTVVTFVAADGSLSMLTVDPTADGTTWVVEVGSGPEMQTFVGEHDRSQWLVFPGVPPGPYVLHTTDAEGRQSFATLDMRDVHADGELRAGRADMLVAQTNTPQLALTVSSMAPLGEGDRLELYSRSAAALLGWAPVSNSEGEPSDPSWPQVGDTTIDGWILPWEAVNVVREVPLLDPAKGDDLWLTHRVHSPLVPAPTMEELLDPWTYSNSTVLMEAAPLELAQAMSDSAIATASGSFNLVAARLVSLDLRIEQFIAPLEANLGPIDDDTDHLYCYMKIIVEPGEDAPIQGFAPTLAEVVFGRHLVPNDPMCPPNDCDMVLCSQGCEGTHALPGDRVLELALANPFDFGTETLVARCESSRLFTNPATGGIESQRAILQLSRALADASGGPIVPALTLPSNIRINAQFAGVDDVLVGVTTTPMIELSPPDVGKADFYRVIVLRLEGEGELDFDNPRRVATYDTSDTSFTLPEGVLELGAYYFLQVEARTGRRLGEARAYSHDQYVAAALSGLFTP